MANTKRRNHFIPRFLLKRFASRVEGNKHWVWQLSRGGELREISTRDAAVATWFYGGPETGVEEAFAAVEAGFCEMLAAIDAGESPQLHSNGLRQFVWTLVVRTRALREQFVTTIDQLLSRSTESAGSEKGRRAFIKVFESSLHEQIEQHLQKLPMPERAVARHLFSIPGIRESFLRLAVEQVSSLDLQKLFDALIGMMRDQQTFTKGARDGQVRGLATLLKEGRVPDSFYPTYWQILRAPSGSFVLGDACIFAVAQDGAYGSLLRFAQSWREIYLPISSSQVLIATRDTDLPRFDKGCINRASSEVASSYIYASQITREIIELAGHIGRGEPLLAEKQLSEIIEGAWGPPEENPSSLDFHGAEFN